MNASHTVDFRREDKFGEIKVLVVKAACDRFSASSFATHYSASSFFFLRSSSYSCSRRSFSSLHLEINCLQPLRCSKGSHVWAKTG